MTDSISAERPYGSWPSSISAQALVEGVVALSGLSTDGKRLYWLEGRPEEGGRTVLMTGEGGSAQALTPAPYNVRSRVHEYGGGAFRVNDGDAYFVNFADQNLYRVNGAPDRSAGDSVHQITHSGPEIRFADFTVDATRNRLLSVVERHHPDREPENCIGAVDLATGELTILAEGHDFYASPRLSPDGSRLAFVAWDHPNMPWDGTMLELAELTPTGELSQLHTIAGGARESVQQPLWQTDEALLFISDANGFWNLYRFDTSGIYCVLEDGADYAGPAWAFDARSYLLADAEHAIVRRHGSGGEELVLVNTRTTLATPLTDAGGARLSFATPTLLDGTLYYIASFRDRMPAIEQMPLSGGEPTTVLAAGGPELKPHDLATGTPLTFPTRDGQEAHAYFYQPANSACTAPAGERPPLLVLSHGGPTSATTASLSLAIQYYTSRGWAVLDVNYRGSSGYGRAYRAALNGRWGIVDVTDCEDGVRHLVRTGQVDGDRVAIRGGSAGGYTTLAALTTTHTFRAGASHYGIGDLAALARDTHKFESQYLNSLLGEEAALVERSPINHLDAFNCPVIFFQGSDDKVVPPNQSQAMAEALRAKGLPVAYLEFSGEGHGFRDAKNIIRTIESEYAFFCRVFGIEPADDLPELTIDNQDSLDAK